jgi:LAO/AO transport system kinase
MTATTTLERFKGGDKSALARILTVIENREKGYRELLSELYRQERHAVRIGITGPPGAGKSTLVDCISRMLHERGSSVAIVAVDPSSPFTGGALLGDRVRSREQDLGQKSFFRSMATRGSQGGLSGSTDNVALALDAFGFDYVLIETVGVGQVELDIIDNCDLVTVVLVPESGDAVQTLKAGLTEIADIFVVNKADRPGADRVVADLTSMLDIRNKEESGKQQVPIFATDAVRETNVAELVAGMLDFLRQRETSGALAENRKRQIRGKIGRILQQRFLKETSERFSDSGEIERTVDLILAESIIFKG